MSIEIKIEKSPENDTKSTGCRVMEREDGLIVMFPRENSEPSICCNSVHAWKEGESHISWHQCKEYSKKWSPFHGTITITSKG